MAKSCASHKTSSLISMILLAGLLMSCLATNELPAYNRCSNGSLLNMELTTEHLIANQYNIQRIRIYDPNPATLQALGGSNIEVVLSVPDVHIPNIVSKSSE